MGGGSGALLDLRHPAPPLLLLVHLRQVGLRLEALPLRAHELLVDHRQLPLAQPRLEPADVLQVGVTRAREQLASLG